VNNKPKYHLFKNTSYAISGLIHALKTESSFRLELFFALFIVAAIIFLEIELVYKLVLLVTGILVLIVELINSAIENAVDLVTLKRHPLAKTSKDLGSSAVMFAIVLHITCWIVILL
jgi:diacylglycerol kinase (ATP)